MRVERAIPRHGRLVQEGEGEGWRERTEIHHGNHPTRLYKLVYSVGHIAMCGDGEAMSWSVQFSQSRALSSTSHAAMRGGERRD